VGELGRCTTACSLVASAELINMIRICLALLVLMSALCGIARTCLAADKNRLTAQQITMARQIGGYGLKNCGFITVSSDGYEFMDDGALLLNRRALIQLKSKKPFLLTYKSSRKDGFPAFCLVGNAKGQVYTVGFPLHDDEWNRLRKLECQECHIKSAKDKKYLQCG